MNYKEISLYIIIAGIMVICSGCAYSGRAEAER